MNAPQERTSTAPEAATASAIARRLAALVAVLVLAGLNRKLAWPPLNAPVLGVLRLRDVLVMLLFAPLVLLQSLDLFRRLGGFRSAATTSLFVLGGYLLGAGFGMHEPFNRLHLLWRNRLQPEVLAPVVFFDDGLGHWLFFAGFGGIVLAGVIAELKARPGAKASWGSAALGVVVAALVTVNMWREKTTVDLAVMAAVCGIAALFHARLAPREIPPPLTATVYIGFGGGTIVTLAIWFLRAVGH